jgi:hypothetical protein
MSAFKDFWRSISERISREWKKILAKITGDEPEPDAPQADASWRTDLADIPAANGVLRFRTRNVQRPPHPKPNGDSEYIICRAFGDGFTRMMVMTMEGGRPPSRIHWQVGGHQEHTNHNVFQVPLMEEAAWEITGTGGAIVVKLNGAEVWRMDGHYTVKGGRMGGDPGREFLGEWSL